MLTADTRANEIGAIVKAEGATHWTIPIQGSLVSHPDATVALDNITSATALFVAYVDAGKSIVPGMRKTDGTLTTTSDEDWSFSFTRIAAGQYKLASSYREFNIGENLVASAGGAEAITWGTTVSDAYYIVKIASDIVQTATVTSGTIVKKASKTSSTVINLKVGMNSFLVKNDTGQTACHIDLGTEGANVLVAVHLMTNWTINQLELWY
jgi:hypothetical protein